MSFSAIHSSFVRAAWGLVVVMFALQFFPAHLSGSEHSWNDIREKYGRSIVRVVVFQDDDIISSGSGFVTITKGNKPVVVTAAHVLVGLKTKKGWNTLKEDDNTVMVNVLIPSDDFKSFHVVDVESYFTTAKTGDSSGVDDIAILNLRSTFTRVKKDRIARPKNQKDEAEIRIFSATSLATLVGKNIPRLGDESCLTPGTEVVGIGYPWPSKSELDNNKSLSPASLLQEPDQFVAAGLISGSIEIRKNFVPLQLLLRKGQSGGPIITRDGIVVAVAGQNRSEQPIKTGKKVPSEQAFGAYPYGFHFATPVVRLNPLLSGADGLAKEKDKKNNHVLSFGFVSCQARLNFEPLNPVAENFVYVACEKKGCSSEHSREQGVIPILDADGRLNSHGPVVHSLWKTAKEKVAKEGAGDVSKMLIEFFKALEAKVISYGAFDRPFQRISVSGNEHLTIKDCNGLEEFSSSLAGRAGIASVTLPELSSGNNGRHLLRLYFFFDMTIVGGVRYSFGEGGCWDTKKEKSHATGSLPYTLNGTFELGSQIQRKRSLIFVARRIGSIPRKVGSYSKGGLSVSFVTGFKSLNAFDSQCKTGRRKRNSRLGQAIRVLEMTGKESCRSEITMTISENDPPNIHVWFDPSFISSGTIESHSKMLYIVDFYLKSS